MVRKSRATWSPVAYPSMPSCRRVDVAFVCLCDPLDERAKRRSVVMIILATTTTTIVPTIVTTTILSSSTTVVSPPPPGSSVSSPRRRIVDGAAMMVVHPPCRAASARRRRLLLLLLLLPRRRRRRRRVWPRVGGRRADSRSRPFSMVSSYLAVTVDANDTPASMHWRRRWLPAARVGILPVQWALQKRNISYKFEFLRR